MASGAIKGLDTTKLGGLADAMRAEVAAGRVAGVVSLVAQGDDVQLFEATGKRDIAAGLPMAYDTIFRVYSMTKPVTSVAILRLWEDGLLDLDDPVGRHVPEFADMEVYNGPGRDGGWEGVPAASPITIRQLLTHTGGLGYTLVRDHPVSELFVANDVRGSHSPGSLGDVMARVSRLPLRSHPGAEWQYSIATDVLGHIMEVVTGEGLDKAFRRLVLDPLGMHETGFQVPAGEAERFATVYTRGESGGLLAHDVAATSRFLRVPEMLSGGGGLVSTAAEYLRFTQMLLRGGSLHGVRILKPETVAAMTVNQLPDGADIAAMGARDFNGALWDGIGFGFGVSVIVDPAQTQLPSRRGEYGWTGAASTAFWNFPDRDVTAIQLAQFVPSPQLALRKTFRTALDAALV